jgi:lysylphosphatidylglycerol synthetase-like protein (DUF2156 family)
MKTFLAWMAAILVFLFLVGLSHSPAQFVRDQLGLKLHPIGPALAAIATTLFTVLRFWAIYRIAKFVWKKTAPVSQQPHEISQ